MTAYLNADTQGVPLRVFCPQEFKLWSEQQAPNTVNWLRATGYQGEGLALIPAENGELSEVVFVTADPADFFATGELPVKLPATQYRLHCDEQYREALAFGWAVGCYRFERYRDATSERGVLAVADEKLADRINISAAATALVRDLVNTPAADMMPVDLAAIAQRLCDQFAGEYSEIVGDQLLEQGYPMIHAVGRASDHQPRLIDFNWGEPEYPKVTLVGKGVCFDSGGLDLKNRTGMRHMKKDMGGAAHVLGLAQMIMASGLPVRLRVLIPAVENAVSGNALRPGDVIKTRSGKTVEIDNTDAEGRLILGDALLEADTDDPDLLVDFATLTGAMRVALGTELPGFFATSEQSASDLSTLAEDVSDPVWRMPLHQPYRSLLRSDVADLANTSGEAFGGAIIAALYLQEFVSSERDWMHFDVMAWNKRALPGKPTGGEAFGIRALFSYLERRYR